MAKTIQSNTNAADIAEDIRRYQLERFSNMGGYLARIAAHPIAEDNRHAEFSWGEERGREAID